MKDKAASSCQTVVSRCDPNHQHQDTVEEPRDDPEVGSRTCRHPVGLVCCTIVGKFGSMLITGDCFLSANPLEGASVISPNTCVELLLAQGGSTG